jgi:hypothetical protein
MKNRRITGYHDTKHIKNEETTIVYGCTDIKAKRKVAEDFNKLGTSLLYLSHAGVNLETKGVSKLHPEDSYDEKTGRIVASIKAELKGLDKAEECLNELKSLMLTCMTEIDEEMEKLTARKHSLEKIKF